MSPLATWTPAEVDTPLAVLYDKINDLRADVYRLTDERDRIDKRQAQRDAGTFIGYRRAEDDSNRRVTVQTKIDDLTEQIAGLHRECEPYQAEYHRRGGWTRAWLVDNSNGHVHRTMDCSTCYPTTLFGWLPQVSGLDEDEIVALAGESACTICYPTAPAEVLNNPSALELPRRREERLAREAERDAKRAAKAAKSLSLDGSLVTVRWDYERTYWNPWAESIDTRREKDYKDLRTYRAAELFVVDGLAGTGYEHPPADVIHNVIAMMAAKKGVTVDEIRGPLQAKADKKRAKG